MYLWLAPGNDCLLTYNPDVPLALTRLTHETCSISPECPGDGGRSSLESRKDQRKSSLSLILPAFTIGLGLELKEKSIDVSVVTPGQFPRLYSTTTVLLPSDLGGHQLDYQHKVKPTQQINARNVFLDSYVAFLLSIHSWELFSIWFKFKINLDMVDRRRFSR